MTRRTSSVRGGFFRRQTDSLLRTARLITGQGGSGTDVIRVRILDVVCNLDCESYAIVQVCSRPPGQSTVADETYDGRLTVWDPCGWLDEDPELMEGRCAYAFRTVPVNDADCVDFCVYGDDSPIVSPTGARWEFLNKVCFSDTTSA